MTTVLSILAVAVSVAALVVSWWLGLRSARAAERSSEDARRVARAEVNRDHEMYRPLKGSATFEKVHERTGKEDLFLVFTPGRTYRMAGDAIFDAGPGREARMPLDLSGGPARGGTPVRLFVGELSGGDGSPLPKALRLRFWPPAEGDPGEPWSCHCGRPLEPSGDLHWEWRIELPNNIDPDVMRSVD